MHLFLSGLVEESKPAAPSNLGKGMRSRKEDISITRTTRIYVYICKALRASEESTNSKPYLTNCAALLARTRTSAKRKFLGNSNLLLLIRSSIEMVGG